MRDQAFNLGQRPSQRGRVSRLFVRRRRPLRQRVRLHVLQRRLRRVRHERQLLQFVRRGRRFALFDHRGDRFRLGHLFNLFHGRLLEAHLFVRVVKRLLGRVVAGVDRRSFDRFRLCARVARFTERNRDGASRCDASAARAVPSASAGADARDGRRKRDVDYNKIKTRKSRGSRVKRWHHRCARNRLDRPV